MDFLSTVLYFIEKGQPLPISFKKTKQFRKIKNANYDELFELSRKLVLAYYGLKGRSRKKKVISFLKEGAEVTLPGWMERRLRNLVNFESYVTALRSGTAQWFRINRIKGDEDKVLKSLESKGIIFERDTSFKYIYKVISGNITKTEEFKEYKVIIQDKASVAVVEALKPERGDLIFEMASAPGLKAELIYEITEGDVELVLAELDEDRIAKERDLLLKYGVNLTRVDIVNQDSTMNSIIRADKVLVDAPCTTSGLISKDPSILLSLRTPEKVLHFAKIQESMLSEALKLRFKKGVYSVCSIFPEEGELILEKFSNRLIDTEIQGRSSSHQDRVSSRFIRFFSYLDDTEDFFIATFRGSEDF
ncbi:RsmB/NOP family class I SAM-dependent RNA methyltransferase [Metallosphaera hakonensis]|uniref:RsmB/NOP family class I SAM-dependent RNA methyltransferase n=1 Tax=Metallosphaera hakonensis TaxID=79601 RepID=UPI001F0EC665|nr:RsmB/NOP family class I SAM-dependent RNA methyltransferase [Metallosphaera hakonensis]